MADWTNAAAKEIAALEKEYRHDPATFMHRDGQPAKGPPTGVGQARVRSLAATLEDLARRCRGLVTA